MGRIRSMTEAKGEGLGGIGTTGNRLGLTRFFSIENSSEFDGKIQ